MFLLILSVAIAAASGSALELAREFAAAGEATDAIAMYREVVAASPKTASARYELGGLLLKHSITHAVGDGKLSLSDAARRDVEEARKHLRVARELRPRRAEIAVALAISLCQPPWPGITGREEAVRLFSEAASATASGAALEPERLAEVATMGGEAAMALGDTAVALALYTEAAAKGPDPIAAALGIAKIYLVLGAPADAGQVLSRLTRLPPNRIDFKTLFEAHTLMGESRFTLGRRRSAFKAWGEALEIAHEAGHQSFVRSYEKQRDRPLRAVLHGALLLLQMENEGTSNAVTFMRDGAKGGPVVATLPRIVDASDAASVVAWFDRSRDAIAAAPLVCFVSAVVPLLVELLASPDAAALRPMLHAVRGSWGERMCVDAAAPPSGDDAARAAVRERLVRAVQASNFSSSVFLTRAALRGAALAGATPAPDAAALGALVELEARIEEKFGLPQTNALATQLLRYGGTHAALALHTDCSPGLREADRAATALVYLTAPAAASGAAARVDIARKGSRAARPATPSAYGGETVFPRLGVTVHPAVGKALVFSGLTDDGWCDPLSVHESVPVQGDAWRKLTVQKWYTPQAVSTADQAQVHEMRALGHVADGRAFVLCDASNSCREYWTLAAAAPSEAGAARKEEL